MARNPGAVVAKLAVCFFLFTGRANLQSKVPVSTMGATVSPSLDIVLPSLILV
jgi:hypothetical protein